MAARGRSGRPGGHARDWRGRRARPRIAEGYPPAPYLPPLAAAHFLATDQLPANTVLPATVGHIGAPAAHRHGPHPILLYSPGGGGGADGALDAGPFEDLATHGYADIARARGQTPDQLAAVIGALDPTTAVTDERAYIRAFFDRFLRHRDNHLLDRPSPRFPDMQFPS
jgi:hypothetical protein